MSLLVCFFVAIVVYVLQRAFLCLPTRFVFNVRHLRLFDAIVLFPCILFRSREDVYAADRRLEITLKHELVHVRQVRRAGFLRFYVSYVAEFVCRMLLCRLCFKAMSRSDLSYEREAYDTQYEPLTVQEWKVVPEHVRRLVTHERRSRVNKEFMQLVHMWRRLPARQATGYFEPSIVKKGFTIAEWETVIADFEANWTDRFAFE